VREISSDATIHVIEGQPWRDAISRILEPHSFYRPWLGGDDVEPGDVVLVLLDTEPRAVLAGAGVVGSDGRVDSAIGDISRRHFDHASLYGPPALLELATLNLRAEFDIAPNAGPVDHDTADIVRMVEKRISGDRNLRYLHGHSSLAQARVLIDSGGRCGGCDGDLGLAQADTRERVHIHTVDYYTSDRWAAVVDEPPREEPPPRPPEQAYSAEAIRIDMSWHPIRFPPDWPAALCEGCHDRMRNGRFGTFLDFRFRLHPQCPSCEAQRTLRTASGFGYIAYEPWLHSNGCTPKPKWLCGGCGHQWDEGFGLLEVQA